MNVINSIDKNILGLIKDIKIKVRREEGIWWILSYVYSDIYEQCEYM